MSAALVRAAALAGSLLCWPLGAAALCTVPAPPDPASKPAKPTPPVKGPCVDQKPGAEGCLGWEAYSFNEQVKAYNAKIPAFKAAAETYVGKLNAYVAAAAAYAKCEVDTLR
jgi:hypothetical protein